MRLILAAAIMLILGSREPAHAGPEGFEVGETYDMNYACTYDVAETIADAGANHTVELAMERHRVAAGYNLCMAFPPTQGTIVSVENLVDVAGTEIQLIGFTFEATPDFVFGLVVSREAAISLWQRTKDEV